jgi:hypothetical protein
LYEAEILGAKLRDAGQALRVAERDLRKAPKSSRKECRDAVKCCQISVEQAREDFRKKQIQLWQEQKSNGNPWLITDLITLGSPLAHMDYLLRAAGDRDGGLHERETAREFPRCPPLKDNWQRELQQCAATKECAIAYRPLGQRTRIIVPSALFAFVRWTNLYFPGDLIGGALAPEFGYGVRDIQVRRYATANLQDFLASWSPRSHTKYWEASSTGTKTAPAASETLREVLALEDEDTEALLREVAGIQRS